MNTNSAAMAPASAPDTGASTVEMPAFASPAAISLVNSGSEDDVSSSRPPGLKPCTSPRAPSAVSRTSTPEGSIVMTMSEALATAAGVSAAFTPGTAARNRAMGSGFKSRTVSG